jgi:hypothetical protein
LNEFEGGEKEQIMTQSIINTMEEKEEEEEILLQSL